MADSTSRFARQDSLVPRDQLAGMSVTVIGVGAIGRQVALQLAALGIPRIQLVDFDVVEPTNITTQGYLSADLGQTKVGATAAAIQQIDPTIYVQPVAERYRPQLAVSDVVFCCVDSITARAAIWRSAGQRSRFWCDGRMLAEVMRILTVAALQGRDHYPTTLFAQVEAQTGSCTARGTLYTASIAAGLMLHQFTRWLRGLPIDTDLAVNLLASELVAA
jgi:hypothetical protein